MQTHYEVTLQVNGVRTSVVVRAGNSVDARMLAEAQFAGAKVAVIFLRQV